MGTTLPLRALLVVAGAAALLAAYAAIHGASQSPAAAPRGLAATVAVAPVVLGEPAPRAWQPLLYAESLSARLARTPGLSVPTGGAEFTVRTDATTRDGRLVVATRLYRRNEDQPLWSGTFWRRDDAATTMVDAVAADVTEALFGYLGRRAAGDVQP